MDSTYKTNKYVMSRFEVDGLTNANNTFLIAYVILPSELQASYEWALEQLRGFCCEMATPSVAVTNRDDALISAVVSKLLDFKHLLCRRHVPLANANKFFRTVSVKNSELHCKIGVI